MHQTLLWILFILWYDIISGEYEGKAAEELLHTMKSTLKESETKIILKIDNLSEKLDSISKEVERQKSTIEDMKESLKSSDKVEIGVLKQNIESFRLKQLKDQNSTNEYLEFHADQLKEIKNVTVVGVSMVYEKLDTVNGLNRSLSKFSGGVERLRTEYTEQETKLDNIHGNLKQTTELIERGMADNSRRMETLQKEIVTTLNEQSKPLSSEALSHVNKVVTIAKRTSGEMERFDDLEPKLLHLFRLSENLQKDLPNNHLVNNLTVSLTVLKNSAPSVVSSVSKNMKELNGALQDLKAMSKDNNCPVDLTSEIHDHHNKIIKYLNDTISGCKDKEGEIWDDLKKKFENIDTRSATSGNINERLIKLREDIGDIRNFLQEKFEESETSDDTVFG